MERATVQYDADKYPNFKEYLWFKANEEELIKRFYGRYVVIKDEQVIADFGSPALAWQTTIKTHRPGTFVIQHCVPRSERRIPKLATRQLVTVQGTI